VLSGLQTERRGRCDRETPGTRRYTWAMGYGTILVDFSADHVATVTLNRPEVMNAFNQQMADECADVWRRIKDDDDVHAVVLRAAGDRAFCSGRDVQEIADLNDPVKAATMNTEHPMWRMGPKLSQLWKPVITAVHGLAGGGAYYWINESDLVVASDDAQFFDPHISYGLAAGPELIGLARRIPMVEATRLVLLGLDERISAESACRMGLVNEVVPRDQLWDRAQRLATSVAAKPTAAVQSTIRALWESLDLGRTEALRRHREWYLSGSSAVDRATFVRPTPLIR
jgi:enoyl-CoA hydratase/carnithine racemase